MTGLTVVLMSLRKQWRAEGRGLCVLTWRDSVFPCLLHGAGGKKVYLREDRKKKKLTVTTYSFRDFPDGPVLRLQTSSTGGVGLISGQETKIPHALWCGQKTKKIFLITNSEYGMLMLVIFFL